MPSLPLNSHHKYICPTLNNSILGNITIGASLGRIFFFFFSRPVSTRTCNLKLSINECLFFSLSSGTPGFLAKVLWLMIVSSLCGRTLSRLSSDILLSHRGSIWMGDAYTRAQHVTLYTASYKWTVTIYISWSFTRSIKTFSKKTATTEGCLRLWN